MMTHQGLIFARWIDYRVLATILKIDRTEARSYCEPALGIYGANLIPKFVSAQDGAAMERKAREISHALDAIEPFTHCYNCGEPIQDLKDWNNLGYLPIRGTESSGLICAKCVQELNLRTNRQLLRLQRRKFSGK